MKNYLKSSNAKKIIFITLIFTIILGISVLAGNVKLNNVNIKSGECENIKIDEGEIVVVQTSPDSKGDKIYSKFIYDYCDSYMNFLNNGKTERAYRCQDRKS